MGGKRECGVRGGEVSVGWVGGVSRRLGGGKVTIRVPNSVCSKTLKQRPRDTQLSHKRDAARDHTQRKHGAACDHA